jgi:hypothetical protein
LPGWGAGRILAARDRLDSGLLAVAALRMPLITRRPLPCLMHHPDRGVQYASHDYKEMLKQHHAAALANF